MMQNSKFKCHSKPQRATPRCFQLRAEGRTNPKTKGKKKRKKKKKKLQKQHKKLQGIYELHGRKHLRRPAACRASKSDRRRRQRLSTANQKQKPKYKKTKPPNPRKGKPNVNETETKSETKPKSNDKCSHQGLRAVELAKSSWPKPKSKHKVLNASGNHLKPSINQRKQ